MAGDTFRASTIFRDFRVLPACYEKPRNSRISIWALSLPLVTTRASSCHTHLRLNLLLHGQGYLKNQKAAQPVT